MNQTDEHPNNQDPLAFLAGGGEMGRLMREHDWSVTSLGSIMRWPQSLKTTVSVMVNSRYPMFLAWGPELTFLYNDAYIPVLGKRHPNVLGHPAPQVWKEIWNVLGPQVESVQQDRRATWNEDLLLVMERNGYVEETYFTFSYSPAFDNADQVAGVFCACNETTGRVLGERRLRILRELGAEAAREKSVEDACRHVAHILDHQRAEIPFSLIYQLQEEGQVAVLTGSSGFSGDGELPASKIDLIKDGEVGQWPLKEALKKGSSVIVQDLIQRYGELPKGTWSIAPAEAMVFPLRAGVHDNTFGGVLVVGVNSGRRLDTEGESFLELVAKQTAGAITSARAHEEERKRAEALAELDRAKTAFFSNVSHEFRTPLTLMLGPLEDALANVHGILPMGAARDLTAAHRNSLRLLKLVNTMLDFSRIEAGRAQANYVPTDLGALTAEFASIFRSACEKAGVQLIVNCSPLTVYVDRDMWEKIVLNLISNAFKFTFEGVIEVRLDAGDGHAQLTVRDTGVGIPSEELPRMFERFHRVEGSRGRTYEGTGIGLALVQELVKLHGGAVGVNSVLKEGSCFTVTIPLGTAHLDLRRVGKASQLASTSIASSAFIEEALRWLPSEAASSELEVVSSELAFRSDNPEPRTQNSEPSRTRPRVLVVDDNADMRDYVSRLLRDRFDVEVVADGQAALEAVRTHPPNLVLSDVMIPKLDGFGLVRELRNDPATQTIPIILLTARAGEESKIEGLERGADDYLSKPFNAKELVARIESHLDLARVRREAQQALLYSTAQFETLLNQAPLGVYLVDADFRIRQINPTARPVFGDIPDLIGRDFDEVIHILLEKRDADEIVNIFRHTLSSGEPYWTPEWAEFRIDRGVTEYYEWRLDRITLPDGRYGVVCYFRDISGQIRARETVRDAEERLRLAVESAEIGTWDLNLITGENRWDNRCKELFGFPADTEVSYATFLTMVHPGDRTRVEAVIQRSVDPLSDGLYDVEYRIRRTDGTERCLRAMGRAFFEEYDGARRAVRFTGTALDVTERKHHEQELMRRNIQQSRLYEFADAVNRAGVLGALYEKALDTIIGSLAADRASILLFDEDGVMRFKAWRGVSDGYRHAVEGHSPWQKDSQDPRAFAIGTIKESGINPSLRAVIQHEGIEALAFVPLMHGGRLLGKVMLYFNHPYTMNNEELDLAQAIASTLALGIEQTTSNLRLRESEELLRSAMTAGEMAAWDVDLAKHTVTWDAKQSELFGHPSVQSPTPVTQLYTMVHADDVQRVKRAIAKAEESGRFTQEFRIVRPDGHVRWIAGHGAIVRSQEGRAVRMVGVNYDITDRKEAQFRIEQFAVELERQVVDRTEKLEYSQKQLRALASELNLAEQRERKRLAAELHDHLQQMLVLGKLKLGQGKRLAQPIPACAEIIKQTDDVLSDALEYTRTLVAELSPPVLREHGLAAGLKWLAEYMKRHEMKVMVYVPESNDIILPEDQAILLFQSVRELLINASKHAQSNEVAVTLERSDTGLRIQVRDRGVGFDLEAIAAPTRDETHDGGLSSRFGLFSLQERMKALGGRFDIDSAVGRGTTATLSLPLQARDERDLRDKRDEQNISGPVAPFSPVSPLSRAACVRVLLVDDHLMMRQGLRSVLESYPDVEVVGEASDGAEAVEFAEKLNPNVVVMDINMPKMNGIEATARIKASYRDILVIGLSVNANAENQETMMNAGATMLLTKEAAVDDLYHAIQKALKGERVMG